MFQAEANLLEIYNLMSVAGVANLPEDYSLAWPTLQKMDFIGERDSSGKLETVIGFGPPEDNLSFFAITSLAEDWGDDRIIKAIISTAFTKRKLSAVWTQKEKKEITNVCLGWGMVPATSLTADKPVFILTPGLVLKKHKGNLS